VARTQDFVGSYGYNDNPLCRVKTLENPTVIFFVLEGTLLNYHCVADVLRHERTHWLADLRRIKTRLFRRRQLRRLQWQSILWAGRHEQGLVYVTLGPYTAARPTQPLTSSRSTELIDNTLSCLQCFIHRTTGNNSHTIASECSNWSYSNLIFCLFRVAISLLEIYV